MCKLYFGTDTKPNQDAYFLEKKLWNKATLL